MIRYKIYPDGHWEPVEGRGPFILFEIEGTMPVINVPTEIERDRFLIFMEFVKKHAWGGGVARAMLQNLSKMAPRQG